MQEGKAIKRPNTLEAKGQTVAPVAFELQKGYKGTDFTKIFLTMFFVTLCTTMGMFAIYGVDTDFTNMHQCQQFNGHRGRANGHVYLATFSRRADVSEHEFESLEGHLRYHFCFKKPGGSCG